MTAFKVFEFFHLSPEFLGEKCVLTPHIPISVWEDSDKVAIEDEITPRVSFANSIERALASIAENPYTYFIYFTRSPAGSIRPTASKVYCPHSTHNPYGPAFNWRKFAKRAEIDSEDDSLRRKLLLCCVPDATITQETWATKPTKVSLNSILLRSKSDLARFGGIERRVFRGSPEYETIVTELLKKTEKEKEKEKIMVNV